MRSLVAAFVLGCTLLQHESRLPSFHPLWIAAVALAVAAIARPRAARWAAVVVAGGLLGYGYAAWRAEERLAESLPFALEGQDVRVSGIVASLPQADARGVRFVLHVERGDAVPEWIALTWYAGRDGPAPRIVAGQRRDLVEVCVHGSSVSDLCQREPPIVANADSNVHRHADRDHHGHGNAHRHPDADAERIVHLTKQGR